MIENTKKINALYQKYLYRDADPEGLFLYQRKILGGTSIESIENEFKKSEERSELLETSDLRDYSDF